MMVSSLWTPRSNAISLDKKQPYLAAEEIEEDYPLMLVGGSTAVGLSPHFIAKIGVMSDLTAKDGLDIVPEIIALVIKCESGWNQAARGAAGEIGIAQFMPNTWIAFNKMRGTDLDIYSQADQLDMILWAYDNDLMSHWTCWKQLVYSK